MEVVTLPVALSQVSHLGRCSQGLRVKIIVRVKLERKLENLVREGSVYGLAVLAFALVMYFILVESARDIFSTAAR